MASRDGKRLAGKVALITGGSRGIGKAIALAYAREGGRVFICGRKERDLDLAAGQIRALGGEVAWGAADVSRVEDVTRLTERVRRVYGTVHILVNNASILGPREPIVNYPLPSWEEVLRINLTGIFLVTKEVLKMMMSQREGSIINISSGVGRIGKARWGAYAASKFGVEGLTQVVAEEVKEWGIRANAVNPGGTRTSMRAEAYPEEDPGTLPSPEEITEVFLYLASAASHGITGKSFDARDWLRQSH
ncbi:MAG: SDR family NAD(P)-dependent oxidoreductase [Deltaproteobacteria bacterium]|nr:SDR family NAD(P)-dependent oxidoreductase [Deltaproteobacteria bacterium]